MLPIKFLTIHCAATPEGRDVKAATIDDWDRAKFGQVSYHGIIELDGTYVDGMADNKKGAHVGGKNTGNIGICYVGGMDKWMRKPKDTRTDAQKMTMKRVVQQYAKEWPGLIVRGHNEWPGVKKACPSFSVPDWLAEFSR